MSLALEVLLITTLRLPLLGCADTHSRPPGFMHVLPGGATDQHGHSPFESGSNTRKLYLIRSRWSCCYKKSFLNTYVPIFDIAHEQKEISIFRSGVLRKAPKITIDRGDDSGLRARTDCESDKEWFDESPNKSWRLSGYRDSLRDRILEDGKLFSELDSPIRELGKSAALRI